MRESENPSWSARIRRFHVIALLVLFIQSGCLKSDEKKSEDWIQSGRAYLKNNDYDSALIEFGNAVRVTPKSAEAHYLAGTALLGLGDPGRAARSFQSAIELQPTHTQSRLKLADLLNASGDPKYAPIAEEHARAALTQRPEDPDVLRALAIAEWRQKKTQLAVEHLDAILRKHPGDLKAASTLASIQASLDPGRERAEQTLRSAVQAAGNSPEGLVVLGQFLMERGDSTAAEKELQRAIDSKSDFGPALFELAKLLQSTGRQGEAEQMLLRASRGPDKAFRTVHALFLFEDGRKDAAIAELRETLNREPENKEVRTQLVDYLIQSGQFEQAETEIKAARNRRALSTTLLEQEARLHLQRRRYEEAGKSVESLLASRPESATGHYLMAQVRRGQGRDVEYRKELQLASTNDPTLIPARVELSENLRKARDLRGAFDVIDGSPPSQKGLLPILIERAWVLMAQGRHDEARLDSRKALALSRTPATLLQAGLLALQEKKGTEGRALLEEALQYAPDDAGPLNAIVLSLLAEKKAPEALARLRKQAALRPQSAQIQLALGSLLERMGDRPGARDAYSASLRLDPTNNSAVVANARMEMIEGRWDTARSQLQGLLKQDPNNVDGWLALGMVEEGSGNGAAAVQAYRKVLQRDGSHVVAKNNLIVRLCDNTSSLDEALMLALELKQALPQSAEVDDTVGWVYYKRREYVLAIEHLSRASSRSQDPRFKYRLAMAYYAAGNRSLGRKVLDAALALNPNLPEAQEARRVAEGAP